MIFAKDMKAKADIVNEKRKENLAKILSSLYINVATKIDQEIEEAAARGEYGISTHNLSEEIKLMVGGQLSADKYSLEDAVDLLCEKIKKRFGERGFIVTYGLGDTEDYRYLYIHWGN